MRFFRRLLSAASLLAASLPLTASALSAPSAPLPKGGAVVLDHEALVAFVADSDNSALHRVDLSSGDVTTVALSCAPQEVLRIHENLFAVSLKGCAQIAFVSMSPSGEGEVESTVSVPDEPWGLGLTNSGTLLVTSAWGHALTAIDTTTKSVLFSMDLPREPRGITLSPDGRRALVSHAVGDALSVLELNPEGGHSEAPQVRTLRALTGNQRNRVDKAIGAGTTHNTAALAYTAVWNETGTRLFVPHLLVQNGRDSTRFLGGGYGGVTVTEDTSVADVAVLSAETLEPLVRPPAQGAGPLVPIHTDSFGAPSIAPSGSASRQARAAAVVGNSLWVTSYGTGEIVELNANSLDPAMAVRRTIKVGEGPAGLDVDAQTSIAVVWNQMSHDVAVVSLGSGAVDKFDVAVDPLSDELSRGRRLFHAENDRRISRDGRACVACHPEGRADGLVWRLGGGARKTLLLAGRLDHGPYGWNGEHQELEANIEETIARLGGTGLSKSDLQALAAFAKRGLTPPPSNAVQPSAAAQVARGKEVFQSDQVGCVWCHKLDQDASDRSLHDVGSRGKEEEKATYRTPPLRFVRGAGPYFHDGRYATLEAVIDQNLDRMGNTTSLTPTDKAALIEFLRSL